MRESPLFQKIVFNLNRFIDFYGLRHQFQTDGLYADIDLPARLETHIASLALKEETLVSNDLLKIILDAPDDFYVDPDAVIPLEHACLDLFKRFRLPSISQHLVIDRVIAYQKIKGVDEGDIIADGGHCAGIAYMRCFGALFQREKATSSADFVSRLSQMNALFRRIVEWDGTAESVDEALEADFAFFIDHVVPLQIQNNISDTLELHDFTMQSIATVSWVFNKASLKAYFEKFVVPSQSIVSIRSDHHASCIVPMPDGGYWYMNANSDYGDVFLPRFEDLVERMCAGLSVGHSLTYPDRMPLHVQLLQTTAVEKYAPDAGVRFLAEQFPRDLQLVAANGYNALIEAILTKNLALVKALLSRGIECNVRTVDGYLPIHYALLLNQQNILGRLLAAQRDIRVNTPFPSGSLAGLTLLDVAIRWKRNGMVSLLLAHPNTEIETRVTAAQLSPIEFAIQYDNLQALSELICKNSGLLTKVNPVTQQTVLGYAASLGRYECAKCILRQGEDLPSLTDDELDKLTKHLPEAVHLLLPKPKPIKPHTEEPVLPVSKHTNRFFRMPSGCEVVTAVVALAGAGMAVVASLSEWSDLRPR